MHPLKRVRRYTPIKSWRFWLPHSLALEADEPALESSSGATSILISPVLEMRKLQTVLNKIYPSGMKSMIGHRIVKWWWFKVFIVTLVSTVRSWLIDLLSPTSSPDCGGADAAGADSDGLDVHKNQSKFEKATNQDWSKHILPLRDEKHTRPPDRV
ncbi:unnamed protein product [Linum trigynum]|uniref:Uncharacterized protein n=1 Tax=Linum trigynum TaxID=586398 RepID=A0AAV2FW96_9ROSI